MMERIVDWDHAQFKAIIVKVANMEIAYKAVSFYLREQVSLAFRLLNHAYWVANALARSPRCRCIPRRPRPCRQHLAKV